MRGIARILWINESIYFYPRLRRWYRSRTDLQQRPLTIVDVGANRGQSIRFFLRLFPAATIHSFEPNRRLFEGLQQRFRQPNIVLHPLGLSSRPGELLFRENLLDETSGFQVLNSQSRHLRRKSRILLSDPSRLVRQTYPVKVSTVDEQARLLGWQQVDILKIDVEGHEAEVLQGAINTLLQKQVRYIQFEWHHTDLYQVNFLGISHQLQQCGYHEACRIRHGFGNFWEVIFTHPTP